MALFLLSFVLFLGLFAGVYLSYHTCEEQKTAMKYLNVLKFFFAFIAFGIADYLFFGLSIDFFIVLGIVILLFYIFKDIVFYNQFLFYTTLAFASIFENFYLASVVFLLSLIIGTIETNNFLFSKYNFKKFTTQTKFKLSEIKRFYFNVFSKYHFSLYISISIILFLLFY